MNSDTSIKKFSTVFHLERDHPKFNQVRGKRGQPTSFVSILRHGQCCHFRISRLSETVTQDLRSRNLGPDLFGASFSVEAAFFIRRDPRSITDFEIDFNVHHTLITTTMAMMLSILLRNQRTALPVARTTRLFSDATASATKSSFTRPIRRAVTQEERTALRAERKERATRVLQQQQLQQQGGAAATDASGAATGGSRTSLKFSRWMWYAGVGVPSALLVWGLNDRDSPPAQVCRAIGLTGFVAGFTDKIAMPSHDKLLPDWSQMPNVPHDIPIPHTLVLDLENTLVSSTWDRKYGWRHAKRPGVDKFLHELAQYYEIVLYSPSIDGIADPVVTSLDKHGCIMHRLYRDATYYHNGVHVKDLNRLNRNVNRMIVLDDDPAEVQFNPENHIRVKPYTDPSDRNDTTLARITPFLVEIAREGYGNIPELLRQYQGMDADQIADEHERRIQELRMYRERRTQHGLGGFVRGSGGGNLPAPELLPEDDSYSKGSSPQLTAKDIAGAAPPSEGSGDGIVAWMNRRAKEKEEHQMRKMEKWNEIMLKKQKQKREEAERQQAQS
jgi:import inner membrane translocase subunit TIM50